jgi:hypothetical protein
MTTATREKARQFGIDPPDDGDEGTPESELWGTPEPINDDPLPAFPTWCLTNWQREFVETEAEATQTPADLAAMLTLAAVATAIAKRGVVRVRSGWDEPLCIYCAIALGPGNRKSGVFADVTRPILTFEREEAARLAPEIAEARTRLSIMTKELAALELRAAKERDNNEHEGIARAAVDLSKQIDQTHIIVAPRFIADDTTPERLAALMSEHGGRMAVLSAEGEIFEQMAGKYQSGVQSLNIFLKGHSGDLLRVDRVGRPPDHIDAPALTIGLAVQPSIIEGLADRPGFRGRGLLARFLFAMPETTVGRRDVDAKPVPCDVRHAYEDNIRALLELTPADGEPHVIAMTPEASALISEFAAILEPSLAEYGQFGFMSDWGAKLAGAVVRIAGLLHAGDGVAGGREPWDTPIGAGTVERAREIGSYLLLHARAAMRSMGTDEEIRGARHVLGLIQRREWRSFTRREVERAEHKSAAEVSAALKLLGEHGYIRKRLMVKPATGRPASPIYDVNPEVRRVEGSA